MAGNQRIGRVFNGGITAPGPNQTRPGRSQPRGNNRNGPGPNQANPYKTSPNQRGGGNNPPANWWEGPNSEAEAKRTANAEAGLATNPVINDIRGEARASTQRQKQIGQWYGGLNEQIQQGATQDAAASTAANAALQKMLETSQQGSQAQQAQIAGGNAEFSKLVGADPGAFAQPTQTAAAAGVQRGYTQAALAAPIIQAGASQQSYLRNQAANATHEGIFQRGQEANRRQTILQDLQKAQLAKGQTRIEDLNKLKEAAAKNQISKEAFNLEKTSDAAVAETAAEERAEGRTQQQIENAQKDRSLNLEAKKLANEGQEGHQAALAVARNKIKQHGIPENAAEWADLQEIVEEASEISPLAAAQAVKRLHRELGPKGVAAAQRKKKAAGEAGEALNPFS